LGKTERIENILRAVSFFLHSGRLESRFTFHDLQAKGIAGFDGAKRLTSGHRTDYMVDVYNCIPGIVIPPG
jgi:hypothetical protein